MTNKQLTQQQNLDELFSERKIFLMKQTLLNILSAKGVIYTYYKNQLTKRNYGYLLKRYNKRNKTTQKQTKGK